MTGRAPPQPSEMAPDERKQVLTDAVANALAEPGGWRVESRADYWATIARGRRTNHVLHLVLTVVTLGWWLPAWLIIVAVNRRETRTLMVDAYGNVSLGGDVPRLEESRRWVVLPATRPGRWAIGFLGAAVVSTVVSQLVRMGSTFAAGMVLGLTFAFVVAAGALAAIAIVRFRERAIGAYVAMLPVVFYAVLLALEVSGMVSHG